MIPDEFRPRPRNPIPAAWILLAILLAAAVVSWCAGVRQAGVEMAGDSTDSITGPGAEPRREPLEKASPPCCS